MWRRAFRSSFIIALSLVAVAAAAQAQPEYLGGPVAGLTPHELDAFELGLAEFTRKYTAEEGLGPYYNKVRCVDCHLRHAPGGAGPQYTSNFLFGRREKETEWVDGYRRRVLNPLLEHGGPVLREQALPGYPARQIPDEANAFSRRKTPRLFGLGLIEAIDETDLVRLAARNGGRVVRDDSGRVQRFGSQNHVASLGAFVRAALETELGMTPEEAPEEVVRHLTAFVRLLAPPPPGEQSESAIQGEAIFHEIGCATCHTPSFTTQATAFVAADGELVDVDALKGREVAPYSDFLLHKLGHGLNDNFALGKARPPEFRTAPLWGYRLRLADFLHDSRAANLHQALLYHGGDAAASRAGYLALDRNEKKLLNDFLKSL